MKRAIQQAMRQGTEGIKITVGGRLSGAEMARSVTLREVVCAADANIDYSRATASTRLVGSRSLIYKGIVMDQRRKVESTEGVYISE